MKRDGCPEGTIKKDNRCIKIKSINEFKDRGKFINHIRKFQKIRPHPWVPGSITHRPYIVGMGCDGSTDANIHYVAKKLVEKLGWNYREIYDMAYPKISTKYWPPNFIFPDESYKKKPVSKTTVIPENTTIQNVLDDLYDINNRTLVTVLEEKFEKNKIPLNRRLKDL